MGRYIRGSHDFDYKYAYGRQPSNLGELADWAGTGTGGFGGGLTCQYFLPYGATRENLIDGVGPLTCVYGQSWAASDVLGQLGVDAPTDLEFLIYAIGENWQGVIREVERRLQVPPAAPSGLHLDAGASFSLLRSQWGALAARIGRGVDLARPETFEAVGEALWDSGEDELLPYLALRALQHAVEHDLERLDLVDVDPIDTNLWDVTAEMAGRPGPSWEERAMHARLLHFRDRKADSGVLWRALLAERPADLVPAHYLFSQSVWDSDWEAIEAMIEPLLAVERPDEHRAWLLRWRGEARWKRSGPEAAAEDAQQAAALGDNLLKEALSRAASERAQ